MDRSKTIGGLALLKVAFIGREEETAILDSAIEMLKEQEPVKPIFDEMDVCGCCGECGHSLTHQKMYGDNVLFEERYDYCPACGRKVKWDD